MFEREIAQNSIKAKTEFRRFTQPLELWAIYSITFFVAYAKQKSKINIKK